MVKNNLFNKAKFLGENPFEIAKELLGTKLFTKINESEVTGGIITEVEVYPGGDDKGSRAYQNKKTPKNKVLFEPGGICYTYTCYGQHTMFNIVTGPLNIPSSIFIRAINITTGINTVLNRLKKDTITKDLTNGPGKLTKALGIDDNFYGNEINTKTIWIEKTNTISKNITSAPRVGIPFAKEFSLKPWRFILS